LGRAKEILAAIVTMNKFPLYAALGVPEVWRFEDSLEIWLLQNGSYVRHPSSAIPVLNEQSISQFMESSLTMKRPEWSRYIRKFIRESADLS
jgi:hypothetical protein